MKGNERIAKILQNEYGVEDLTPYEDIEWEIEFYTDEISRVKIRSISKRMFCAPVYAMFDGYHMNWYGDYGSWSFCCTWKTKLGNLAYNSPYYQLEKLESPEREVFDEEYCATQLLKEIREGDWYQDSLDDEERKRFDEFITNDFDYISYGEPLIVYDEICDNLKKLYNAAMESEFEWFSALRSIDERDLADVFTCEIYELYDLGKKAPVKFFIILYMLSVVANAEGVCE